MVTAMSGTDWPAVIGAVGGIVGAIGGVGGPIVAIVARRDSRASAKASRDSADETAKVSRIEADRQHDVLKPPAPARIDPGVRGAASDVGGASLFGSITVQQDYRVMAVGVYSTGGQHQISLPLLIRANQPQDFQIEPWPQGTTEPKTREIRFRFWPPVEGDDVAPWSCRCDRPTGEHTDGDGHWEWVVPVGLPPEAFFAAWRQR